MQQIIAGIILGAGAILFGPRLLSSLAGALRPVGESLLHYSEAAGETVTSSLSAAGNWVSGWVGTEVEPGQPHSEASSQTAPTDKEEESFLEEAETFGKDIVVGLAEEEAISFIKMAVIAVL